MVQRLLCERRLARAWCNETIEIDLGFKFAKKYVWRIYPRSGLSLKPLFFGGRVIDSDYRGKISVILTNFSSRSVDIKKGDQIA